MEALLLKNYQALFFDVDDTLLDFDAAENDALHLLFDEQGLPLTADLYADYETFNHGIWQAIETGKQDRQVLLNSRFSGFFAAYGLRVDGIELEQRYQTLLSQNHQLIDGARNLLTHLKKSYSLYVVTNGVSKTQYRRLQDSGLDKLFDKIFVSEDAGAQKPSPAFFDYVFARLPQFHAKDGLIIGDSLNSDIRGGQIAGLDTCWYNPGNKANRSGLTPTYEVHHLSDLQRQFQAAGPADRLAR